MKKIRAIRHYRFTDAELIRLASDKLNLAARDQAEFLDRGYDAARLNAIKMAKDAFDDYPMDRQLDGDKQEATENKNTLRDKLEDDTRRILIAAKYALAENGVYRCFGSYAIARLKDTILVRQARIVLKKAREHQAALAPEGISVARLDDYELLIATFSESIDTQIGAKAERKASTHERVDLGNALYALIVQLCEVGKHIWYTKNATKYKHYVLYKTSNTASDKADEKSTATNSNLVTTELETVVMDSDSAAKNTEIHVVKEANGAILLPASIAFLKENLSFNTLSEARQYIAPS